MHLWSIEIRSLGKHLHTLYFMLYVYANASWITMSGRPLNWCPLHKRTTLETHCLIVMCFTVIQNVCLDPPICQKSQCLFVNTPSVLTDFFTEIVTLIPPESFKLSSFLNLWCRLKIWQMSHIKSLLSLGNTCPFIQVCWLTWIKTITLVL